MCYRQWFRNLYIIFCSSTQFKKICHIKSCNLKNYITNSYKRRNNYSEYLKNISIFICFFTIFRLFIPKVGYKNNKNHKNHKYEEIAECLPNEPLPWFKVEIVPLNVVWVRCLFQGDLLVLVDEITWLSLTYKRTLLMILIN